MKKRDGIHALMVYIHNVHMIQCDDGTYTTQRDATLQPVLFLILLLFPTCAWKPVLIVLTDRREPHDSHDMKNIRFSFERIVSGDLHVLHVTYSTAAKQQQSVSEWDGGEAGRRQKAAYRCIDEVRVRFASAGSDP